VRPFESKERVEAITTLRKAMQGSKADTEADLDIDTTGVQSMAKWKYRQEHCSDYLRLYYHAPNRLVKATRFCGGADPYSADAAAGDSVATGAQKLCDLYENYVVSNQFTPSRCDRHRTYVA
jgi:hypothetical protein